MGKVLCQGILMPRRAAIISALPDGAPSKVASRAEAGWLAAFAGAHNGGGLLSLQQTLQRQFRLAPGFAAGLREAADAVERTKLQRIEPAVPRILPDHDLGGAARAVIAGQKHAVLEVDLVVQRLEGPDVAVRQYQHDAARVAEAARLHRGMQMKPQGKIGRRRP